MKFKKKSCGQRIQIEKQTTSYNLPILSHFCIINLQLSCAGYFTRLDVLPEPCHVKIIQTSFSFLISQAFFHFPNAVCLQCRITDYACVASLNLFIIATFRLDPVNGEVFKKFGKQFFLKFNIETKAFRRLIQFQIGYAAYIDDSSSFLLVFSKPFT